MIGALLKLQFRSLLGAVLQRNRGSKKGRGTAVLLGFLFLYLGVAFVGMFGFLFHTLIEPYHAAGLDWLYFAMAGLIALALSIFGSVFLAQSTLYGAKDNELLLAMPIPPRLILLSRMVPLLALNAVFIYLVLGPAICVYAIQVGFSTVGILACILSALTLPLLAQAIICLLGWVLNLAMSRMNKTAASVLYTAIFLVIYFYVYFQAVPILNAMSTNGAALASAVQIWVWPLYAMGAACAGNVSLLPWFPIVALAVFGLVCWILSATFLDSARKQHVRKRRRVDYSHLQVGSASRALERKELRRFLNSAVYLTNMGLGIVMVAAIGIAGLIFRSQVLEFLNLLPELTALAPILLCGMAGFMVTMTCISAPSVSLEGKNLWLLKSLPVSTRVILRAKLRFHCRMAMPVPCVVGLVLSVSYGFGAADVILCTLCLGLLGFLCGVLGMVCGLRWARLDWTNEMGPVKQSTALMVTMFGMMGILFANGLACYLLWNLITPTVFLAIVCLELAVASIFLYKLMLGWGVRKWESL